MAGSAAPAACGRHRDWRAARGRAALLPRAAVLAAGAAACCRLLLGSRGAPAFCAGLARGAARPARAPGAAGVVARAAAAAASPPSGKFLLRYFNGRGVVEGTRVMLALAGEDYEDFRYPISWKVPDDMSTVQREEFLADRAAGKMEVSMGMVPILEAGDFKLPQSKAIDRYVARRFGFMGSTLEEGAWVDALAEHLRDINGAFGKKGTMFMKDKEKKKELEDAWFGEELPALLKKLEASLPSSTEGFAVGDKVSLADVLIFRLLKDSAPDRDAASFAAGCPKLLAIAEHVAGLEPVSKWMATRPQTST